jgi:hypothetical protein
MPVSPAYRIAHSKVLIDGVVPLNFRRYPWTVRILDSTCRESTIIKGAQLGLSICCVMRALEEAKTGQYRGIGYFFPSESEVFDFAKARFGPMMHNNPEIWGKHVKDTDSASLKRVGQTFLYFRGSGQRGKNAGGSTSKQKSIPLDRIYLDEVDEMDPGRVDAILHRLDASLDPAIVRLSTPTLPGHGVDLAYQESNRMVWGWECSTCNNLTSLELTYPDCIVEPASGADPYYICTTCGDPIERKVGDWIVQAPEVTGHDGYWVSQLSSPTKTALDIVVEEQRAADTGRRKEFENQTLARAYADIEDQITEAQLEACVGDFSRPLRHEGPSAMGVDPGKIHHFEARVRTSDRDTQQIARGSASSYEELSKIVRKLNVESGIMDMGFDPTAVRKFVADHPGWYGCLYVNAKKTEPDWDHKEHVVKVGREWLLDAGHHDIVEKRVTFHAKDDGWPEYVRQLTNLARTVVQDEKTGVQKPVWVVKGQKNDHLRHASAYAWLASQRVGLVKSVQRLAMDSARRNRSRRPRSAMVL